MDCVSVLTSSDKQAGQNSVWRQEGINCVGPQRNRLIQPVISHPKHFTEF